MSSAPALILPNAVIMKSAIRGVEYDEIEVMDGTIASIFVHWGSSRPTQICYALNESQASEEFAILKQWLLADGGTLTLNGGAA